MKTRGFTLVELLMSAALIPVVALAIYSSLSSGLRLWQTVRVGVADEDVAIFFQKISRDLTNSFYQSEIPFEGNTTQTTFATSVDRDLLVADMPGVVECRYGFDPARRGIFRRIRNRHDLFKERPGQSSRILSDVQSFEMVYFMYDKEFKTFKWTDAWDPSSKQAPLAIQIDLDRQGTGQPDRYRRTVVIPTGGS